MRGADKPFVDWLHSQVHMLIIVFLILTAVDCDTLTIPANGQVSHTAGTTFGQTATYICNTGYQLMGSSIRTCQATGVWSGSAPNCQGVLFLNLANTYF